jgi:hypothetical protein
MATKSINKLDSIRRHLKDLEKSDFSNYSNKKGLIKLMKIWRSKILKLSPGLNSTTKLMKKNPKLMKYSYGFKIKLIDIIHETFNITKTAIREIQRWNFNQPGISTESSKITNPLDQITASPIIPSKAPPVDSIQQLYTSIPNQKEELLNTLAILKLDETEQKKNELETEQENRPKSNQNLKIIYNNQQ